jgi:hypothetical protein
MCLADVANPHTTNTIQKQWSGLTTDFEPFVKAGDASERRDKDLFPLLRSGWWWKKEAVEARGPSPAQPQENRRACAWRGRELASGGAPAVVTVESCLLPAVRSLPPSLARTRISGSEKLSRALLGRVTWPILCAPDVMTTEKRMESLTQNTSDGYHSRSAMLIRTSGKEERRRQTQTVPSRPSPPKPAQTSGKRRHARRDCTH